MESKISMKPFGDEALMVLFEQRIDERIHRQVMGLDHALQKEPGVLETVPAYASLIVYFDPLRHTYEEMKARVERVFSKELTAKTETGRCVTIPVCYGGAYGEDLPFVAKHTGLTEEEVISLHSSRAYRVYMLGFLPGFPYLGGLDPKLYTPRLPTPRTHIPAGSVGIGGMQTGIYPVGSPGGWQLIGRTPISLFRQSSGNGVPIPIYEAGDHVRFEPITEEQFRKIAEEQHAH